MSYVSLNDTWYDNKHNNTQHNNAHQTVMFIGHAYWHKCHHGTQPDVLFGFDYDNQHDNTQNNNTELLRKL
jgi:hypothetical protein